jgi:hypothetical protein
MSGCSWKNSETSGSGDMQLFRASDAPFREGLSWEETWHGSDRGLVKCWENGRTIRSSSLPENVTLTENAAAGQLPPLDWIGGVIRPLKSRKYGSLQYLATLQGIRGEPLEIDTAAQVVLRCSKTGTVVAFTADTSRFA